MASQENYYTPGPRSQSFASTDQTGPPPPPKPSFSPDPRRISQQQILPLDPPLPPPPQAQASPRPQPPLPTSSHSLPITSSFQTQPPPLSASWLPASLPAKSTTELAPVLQNPTLLAGLAQSHPSYASSVLSISTAIDQNLALGSQLLQLESQLRQSRAEAAQLLLQHTTLSTQWRRKQSEMDDALSPWGPRMMYQRLVSSINEQEAVVGALVESFLDDDGVKQGGKSSEKEVSEWVRRIREGTTVLEKRREMRSRWDEGRVGGWR